jgi:hypothetical protein
MNSPDSWHGSHRALDSGQHKAELGRHLIREFAGFAVMGPRFEDQDDGKPGSTLEVEEPPVLCRPHVSIIGGGAGSAIDPAHSRPWGFDAHWGTELSGTHVAVKGKGLPFVDRWHSELAGRTRV